MIEALRSSLVITESLRAFVFQLSHIPFIHTDPEPQPAAVCALSGSLTPALFLGSIGNETSFVLI